MTNYTTTISVAARAKLARIVRAILQNAPKVAWKVAQTTGLVVLSWDAHEIASRDLIPAFVDSVCLPCWHWISGLAPILWPGFSWV